MLGARFSTFCLTLGLRDGSGEPIIGLTRDRNQNVMQYTGRVALFRINQASQPRGSAFSDCERINERTVFFLQMIAMVLPAENPPMSGALFKLRKIACDSTFRHGTGPSPMLIQLIGSTPRSGLTLQHVGTLKGQA